MLLRNTKTNDVNIMKKWAQVILGETTNYEGGSNSRAPIGAAVYDTGAPISAQLHYHHEMSYINETFKNISFMCKKATPGKGYMYVANNDMATDELMKTKLGQKLKEKGLCFIRCMTDKKFYEGMEKDDSWGSKDEKGVFNHWQ